MRPGGDDGRASLRHLVRPQTPQAFSLPVPAPRGSPPRPVHPDHRQIRLRAARPGQGRPPRRQLHPEPRGHIRRGGRRGDGDVGPDGRLHEPGRGHCRRHRLPSRSDCHHRRVDLHLAAPPPDPEAPGGPVGVGLGAGYAQRPGRQPLQALRRPGLLAPLLRPVDSAAAAAARSKHAG